MECELQSVTSDANGYFVIMNKHRSETVVTVNAIGWNESPKADFLFNVCFFDISFNDTISHLMPIKPDFSVHTECLSVK